MGRYGFLAVALALAEQPQRGNALYLDLELPSAQRQLDNPEARAELA